VSAKPNVTVLGGGFAGLETAFTLRHNLGERVALRLISDRDEFLFKPDTVYIPFGRDPLRCRIPLAEPLRRKQIDWVHGRARAIDPERKTVEVGRQSLAYDYLVVATGAEMRPGEIPGLAEHAHIVWTPENLMELGAALERVVQQARARRQQQILFAVPPNNRCAGPLYELALMIDTWLRRGGDRDPVDLVWTTYEDSFLQAFGPRLHTVVREEFEQRDIEGIHNTRIEAVEPGVAHYDGGVERSFDLLITFPPSVAGTAFPGLPADDRGFLRVEPAGRRVKGSEDLFAVGDASNFPIKQAFLALLQADAAAEHLSAELESREPEFDFEPLTLCVIDELNKATFAQVPLRYTGEPDHPIDVDTRDDEHYKVGVSPLWRVAKTALGLYLPWRFGRGEPFYQGMAWEAMDLGLKVMAKALAR